MKLSDIPEGVTRLLQDWSSGNEAALDEILGLVYGRLREEARRQLGRSRYKDQLEAELKEIRESEMWQAGAQVRSLRPDES